MPPPAPARSSRATEVQSVPQCAKEVFIKPLAPMQELPDNNKGNSNVSVECAPKPPSVKVMEKSEIKEPRRSTRTPKPTQQYIEVANINSNSWYQNLIGYFKPQRTLKHQDTFIV